jgi:copper chaperone NosL
MIRAASKASGPRFALIGSLLLVVSLSCGGKRGGPVSSAASQGICPVCKMNVKAGDKWASAIHYKDGTKLVFESPGDMFIFYTSPITYEVPDSHKDLANVEKILVKDYNSGNPIDIVQATLVYRSSVKSPMGPDLIPFAYKKDALLFIEEHGGTLISFGEVTPDMVQRLRKG